jgi:shikimate kinase
LKKQDSVIALGGGAFLNNLIRKNTKKLSTSFWLDVPLEELINRLSKSKQRPLLHKKNTSETVEKIYFDRKKIYNEADYRIKCRFLTSKEIINKILDLYEKSGN